jgi:hypothetical protein
MSDSNPGQYVNAAGFVADTPLYRNFTQPTKGSTEPRRTQWT